MRLQSIILAFCIGLFHFSCTEPEPVRPNILFIAIDDLRPDLGCYGNEIVHSPNLDRLAEEAALFRNHYVSVPTCGASRYSLLTGLRPPTRAHLQNNIFETAMAEQAVSEIPESFIHLLRRNGYQTIGIGKISHSADGLVYGYTDEPSDIREMPHSWDALLFDPGKWGTGWNAFFGYADGENRQSRGRQVKPYESADVHDTGYPDGLTANLAISRLKEMGNSDEPFFMGVGFFKPHLPFNSPSGYWDLYERDSIPISENPNIPEGINRASVHNSGEFNGYLAGDEFPSLDSIVSDGYARLLRQAYYSAISYVDAQVGKVIDVLKAQGLYENTVIIVWGDHGWHLGDQAVWGKHTLFENALRSTLIIRDPKETGGRKISSIVETVDLYPTLTEICGIEDPYELAGSSLKPLLSGNSNEWKNSAYSYFRNGITLRTPEYRITRYFREAEPAIELYDHRSSSLEDENIANEYPEIVSKLLPVLEEGNTGLYEE